jgi:hypothetical protein
MKNLLAIGIVFAPAIFATPTTAEFVLNLSNGCCGAGPYGTVVLTQNGNNEVDFKVDLSPFNNFVQTGQAGIFAFNLMLSSPDVIVPSGFSVLGSSSSQTEHMDTFGNFNYAIHFDGAGGGANPIAPPFSFQVQDAGGIKISDFEMNSTGGNVASFFAADIINNPPAGASSTGAVGTDDHLVAPEPATLFFAGAGLIGLGLLRRRRTSA